MCKSKIDIAAEAVDRDYEMWDMREPFIPSEETLEAAFLVFAPCDYDREALDRWARTRSDAAGDAEFFLNWDNALDESNLATCQNILDKLGEQWWSISGNALKVPMYEDDRLRTPNVAAAFMMGVERYLEDEYPILDEEDYAEREDQWLTDIFDRDTMDLIPADVDRDRVRMAWIETEQPDSASAHVDPDRLPTYIAKARRMAANH